MTHPVNYNALPKEGTCIRAVLDFIFENGNSTGTIIRKELSGKFRPDGVSNAITSLRDRGVLTRNQKNQWCLSASMHRRMNGDLEPMAELQIVEHRERNVFATTISKKNIPSCLGMREGSNDYRAWPSKHV